MSDDTQARDSRIWFVRAGRGGVYSEHFLSNSVVAIGWADVGEIRPDDSDDDIRARFEIQFPDYSDRKRSTSASQVKRFAREVKVGDIAITYDHSSRLYHLGSLTSDVRIESRDVAGEGERSEYVRSVEWQRQVSRDMLSVSSRNSLGSQLTLFQPSRQASGEVIQKASGAILTFAGPDSEEPRETEADGGADAEDNLLESYLARAGEFIEDEIAKLDWEQLQELVAGILRAMGYRTRVSSPGPDRGVDVFASPDGIGLEEPRIFVEVKHRSVRIGAPDIRTFIGGRQAGDRCLYVSTGGFTNEARYEADRSQIPLRLIAMDDLRELLVDYYESLDSETRALVPLRRVYWPTRVE